MNSPASASADSRSFDLLHEKIRRWVWREGWTELRDAQERAVPALINADRDIIIAAATAAGKTEAAFLPILSNLLRDEPCTGSVLYISPLKALINDQWSRLNDLCEELEIPVIGWHGDVSASRKQRFFKNPKGVLLITPESLEAMFVNRGSSLQATFGALRYIVVDELHAFIGSERGKQLQSLMHRVERVCGRRVPRVGLSATLGDMQLAARFLRAGGEGAVEIVDSKSGGQELKVLIKGFVLRPPRIEVEPDLENPVLEDAVAGSTVDVANQIYASLRGSNNLIFPNSRRQVETYADLLRRACERDGYPNEFWPHHGSLSKELREDTERALKDGTRPASAICTTTLELGIDIGAVKSIAQIGAPPSVASLRQRLGRSGRRKGEPAILRGYCVESELKADSDFSDRIRESLVQSVAMVNLLMRGWFEPPRVGGMHASTLVQQILSIIAERCGCTAGELWGCLIASGTFEAIDKSTFTEVLQHLGKLDLIVQSSNGLLLHGGVGEKLVNHYEFYSAFTTDEEFRVVAGGRQLGSVPVAHPMTKGQGLIFGGRRWRVEEVDQEGKTIYVISDKGGAPPQFDGNGAMVHDEVRREMRRILGSSEPIFLLDARGQELLHEARRYYTDASLTSTAIFQEGSSVLLATWCGDWLNDALVLLLRTNKLDAYNNGVAISVSNGSVDRVVAVLRDVGRFDAEAAMEVVSEIENIDREKWDWALPVSVKRTAFASSHLDVEGALSFARHAS
ncbi:DEAD/DEAH box helicase [Paraburkholderia phenazinium]|uniref:ATP-dependent helicase Lhr and Lhr-like helicase n=1 Tax=Paraburkholderia phenazinium TaxID=60549 RepID=A0A1N6FH14_9BURK|nr:DEAD/DEAH box helicase [Paraburkholderia phenazinium]SIN94544.1 ATP-dependent helicase Lhr and Lhr-like helicase [Paraburkholderia phenazinium]